MKALTRFMNDLIVLLRQLREGQVLGNEINLIRTEILAAHVEKVVDIDMVRHRRRLDSLGDKIWRDMEWMKKEES